MQIRQSALIVGASRGLGLGLAREYLRRGWHVTATVRDKRLRSELRELRHQVGELLDIESVDITKPDEIASLRSRLNGRSFDLLFVNAGIAGNPTETVGDVATEEFLRVMETNALGPLRVVERFVDQVAATGSVALMSSALGSITGNDRGEWEVYRASKAALNMLMRSFVARHASDSRSFFTIAPGWVRTDLGGPSAPLDVETSIAGVANAIESRSGMRGLIYVNYRNEILPW